MLSNPDEFISLTAIKIFGMVIDGKVNAELCAFPFIRQRMYWLRYTAISNQTKKYHKRMEFEDKFGEHLDNKQLGYSKTINTIDDAIDQFHNGNDNIIKELKVYISNEVKSCVFPTYRVGYSWIKPIVLKVWDELENDIILSEKDLIDSIQRNLVYIKKT